MQKELSSPFEAALESDIGRLSEEVRLRKNLPENRSIGDEHIVRQSIAAISGTPPPAKPEGPLPHYAESLPPETKLVVEKLLARVLSEGILGPTHDAQNAAPEVLEAFHDALTGMLYPELKKMGIAE